MKTWLDKALIACAGLMSVASILLLLSMVGMVRDEEESFHSNIDAHAAEVEVGLLRLVDALARLSAGDGAVEGPEVAARLEAFAALLNDPAEAGAAEAYLQLPAAARAVAAARRLLAEIGPAAATLSPGDPRAAALADRLRDLSPPIRAATQAALAADDRAAAAFHDTQLGRAAFGVAFLFGLIVFGGLLIHSVLRDRAAIRGLNAELEARVEERTRALAAANDRLRREVAERERSEAETAVSEERLAQAARLVKLGYWIWDAVEDRCEFCSAQHAAAHGVTPEEYIARAAPLDGEFTLVHPEDRARVKAAFAALRAGRNMDIEYRIETPGGARRVREIARPVFDRDGRVVKEIGSMLDISDQHETEMKLFEAQKLESIGKLTGGVAHDFNNLLAVILGNLELLRETMAGGLQTEMIDEAIAATMRGRDLTRNMLSFARRAMLEPQPLNVDAVVGEMRDMLRRTLPETIALRLDLAAAPRIATLDRSSLESALLNLVINARDAMPAGGRLTIETAAEAAAGAAWPEGGAPPPPGDYVRLTVRDDGAGIDAAALPRIFEPFFSTKEPAKNSGLGLSMVQGFVEQSGGRIRVESAPGAGAAFHLWFRAAAAGAAAPPAAALTPAAAVAAAAAPRPARILVVEDEAPVRAMLERLLAQVGYAVVATADSAEAERAFAAEGPFDVLITDVVMPGPVQGPALAERLRARRPGLPVIFLSGYPQEAPAAGDGAGRRDAMLMKPVLRGDLLNAVAAAAA